MHVKSRIILILHFSKLSKLRKLLHSPFDNILILGFSEDLSLFLSFSFSLSGSSFLDLSSSCRLGKLESCK